MFDEITVQRDGYDFHLGVVYERLPDFCTHCNILGHDITACKWLHPDKERDHSKQIIKVKKEAAQVLQYVAKPQPKPQQKNGSTTLPQMDAPQHRESLPVPVASAKPRTHTQENATKDNIPVMYTEAKGEKATSTSYSMPLQGVTDEIVQGKLPVTGPILEEVVVQSLDVVRNNNSGEEEVIFVPETQLTRVVADDDFDDVVQKDLHAAKKLWADMVEMEQPFTPVVSKSKLKKERQKLRSA
ncbi:putative NBS resistance protein [Trifolium pratense]|uniref:Putative NBS resistance protein n=2 Tax=Trifolium pratense TaxID=57577 RepID=A0A2K3NKX8_TRIPR|nr:putative NBS resistance protein [Trifolium pratense]